MILLDYKDSRPIYEQVVEKLQELMLLGVGEFSLTVSAPGILP